MWLARDLLRFAVMVALALLVGVAGGAVWHAAHGGDLLRAIRAGIVIVAGLTLVLGAAPGMTLDGRVSSRVALLGAMQQAAATGRRINPTAMFIGAGIVLIAVGILI